MANALLMPTDDDGTIIPVLKIGTVQNIAINAIAHTVSPNAFTSGKRVVRVVCSKAAYIAFGSDPAASSATLYMPVDVPEYFWIDDADKISVIAAVSGESGICSVSEMG
tara:strand:- start:331 stop:657 length:327 start_codon:yes stop_codon:yes gene_type:complete